MRDLRPIVGSIRQANTPLDKVCRRVWWLALSVTLCLSMVGGTLFCVVPPYARVFDDMRIALPASTLLLLWMSRSAWLLIHLAPPCLALMALSFRGQQLSRDSLLLSTPWIGGILRAAIEVQLVHGLGERLRSGASLPDALSLMKSQSPRGIWRRSLQRLEESVRGGGSLVDGLAGEEYAVPSTLSLIREFERERMLMAGIDMARLGAERRLEARMAGLRVARGIVALALLTFPSLCVWALFQPLTCLIIGFQS